MKAKTQTRRLRWIGDDRYIPGVPAQDLEEYDLARLDYLHERFGGPDAASLIASGLYTDEPHPDLGPDHPDGPALATPVPEVPEPVPAELPATITKE